MSSLYYKFSTECAGEKIVNIGQYLAKMWTKVCGLLFGRFVHSSVDPRSHCISDTGSVWLVGIQCSRKCESNKAKHSRFWTVNNVNKKG